MVKITHNIFEDTFNKSLTHTYNLSIFIGIDRVSYIIADLQQKVLALRTYSFSDARQAPKDLLRQLLIEDAILRERFRTTKIGLLAIKSTLVPDILYDEANKEDYLRMVAPYSKEETFLEDYLPKLDARLLYVFEHNFLKILDSFFPQAKVFHSSTGLLQNFTSQLSSDNKEVSICIYGYNLTVIATYKSQLIFHNIFEFKTSQDCLYYILMVYKQLGFSPQKHLLRISGAITEQSEIYTSIYKYIRNVLFANRPGFYSFGTKVAALPQHFFFDLFSLKLCE